MDISWTPSFGKEKIRGSQIGKAKGPQDLEESSEHQKDHKIKVSASPLKRHKKS